MSQGVVANTFTGKADEKVRSLATRMAQYETQERGPLGAFFAFEARDGFFSKSAKVLGIAMAGLVSVPAAMALGAGLASGATALLASGALGAIAGSASIVITRAVNTRIFSDLHDAHKGNFSKFGHWLASTLPAAAVSLSVGALLPEGLASLTRNAIGLMLGFVVSPVLDVLTSGAIASSNSFADQEFRQQNMQARQLAQRAIASGQSVDQFLEKEQSTVKVPTQKRQLEQTLTAPEQAPKRSNHFTKMIEAERAKGAALGQTHVV